VRGGNRKNKAEIISKIRIKNTTTTTNKSSFLKKNLLLKITAET